MVAKINSFINRFVWPLMVSLTFALITGLLSLVIDVFKLRNEVNNVRQDVNEIRMNDLPIIKKELESLHAHVLHYVEVKALKEKLNRVNNSPQFSVNTPPKTEINFLGPSDGRTDVCFTQRPTNCMFWVKKRESVMLSQRGNRG